MSLRDCPAIKPDGSEVANAAGYRRFAKLRDDEGIAVRAVEPKRKVAGKFHMLILVAAYRNDGGS